MTRKEARAAGLKVFAWGMTCKACRTRVKFVHTATCAACPAKALEARKERDRVVGARVRAEVLKTAKAQALRQIRADANKALRDAEKARKTALREALKAQRMADKKASTVAKGKATRRANKEEAEGLALLRATSLLVQGGVGPTAALLPPWEALGASELAEDASGVVVGGGGWPASGVGPTAALLPRGGPQAPRDYREDPEDWDRAPPWD